MFGVHGVPISKIPMPNSVSFFFFSEKALHLYNIVVTSCALRWSRYGACFAAQKIPVIVLMLGEYIKDKHQQLYKVQSIAHNV